MKPFGVGVAGATCMLFASVLAGEPGHHGAHVHGVAEITLAVEGRAVEIEFSAPAVSVVGFEYEAANRKQVEAVIAAREMLSDGSGMFSFTGTECDLQEATVNTEAVWDGSELDHDEHAGEHEHTSGKQSREEQEDHGHSDAHGHEGAHEHDQPHEGEETHSDIVAAYSFVCADEGRLQAVRVGDNGLPFSVETINVMWVSDTAQGATELTVSKRDIELK